MKFKDAVKESFSNVKSDMSELKLTLLQLLSKIVRNQAVINARLKRLEAKMNIQSPNIDKKIELRM